MENSPKLYLTVLDQHFPMSRTSCLAPFRCQFIDMCHGGGTQTYVNQLFAGGSDSDEAIKIAMELGFATRDLNHPEGEYSEE